MWWCVLMRLTTVLISRFGHSSFKFKRSIRFLMRAESCQNMTMLQEQKHYLKQPTSLGMLYQLNKLYLGTARFYRYSNWRFIWTIGFSEYIQKQQGQSHSRGILKFKWLQSYARNSTKVGLYSNNSNKKIGWAMSAKYRVYVELWAIKVKQRHVILPLSRLPKSHRFSICTNCHQSELKVSGELKYFETVVAVPLKEHFARHVVRSFLWNCPWNDFNTCRYAWWSNEPRAEVFVSQAYAWDTLTLNTLKKW